MASLFPPRPSPDDDNTTASFFAHSSAQRVNTDAVISWALKAQYPHLSLVIAPSNYNVDLLAFASAGHASYTAIEGPPSSALPASVIWKGYIPPSRRIDGSPGALVSGVEFAKFLYKWQGTEFLLYVVSGRDGTEPYPQVRNNYILTTDTHKADALIVEAGRWGTELHDEIWVWDRGYWQKSAELFDSVRGARWEDVILDEDMKKALREDHRSFFDSRDTYKRLKVPWKRGVIYYGPPGNGKTISIKAMMRELWSRDDDPVPTLYVRSFFSYSGPEAAISQIFGKARELAPCYLVIEDLDSLVSDGVRSYFLNEVDGLKGNDGIFMIGSTNHLDRLDPGISKRPSRFDRKYLFPDPDRDQRIAYCQFWQKKLADNKKIEFPDKLCGAIADITNKFSFAYMQEAFVAALLAIARGDTGGESSILGNEEVDGWVSVSEDDGDSDDDDDSLKDLLLWEEIQRQVAILREGMDNEDRGD
ncbi:P-loop containing nucleoside triphosphate hydrolase protein [Bombardia bombarda]|uniref:P-loop containing nucleoside triphosphate hydrolase protein n=1 Tax=Bombardia bombarda TaxID=252184 RepID=A0AA39WLU0_9PEZI|nr:P-loop containing nucleoside triphosphate hydrolase protein [Bombardia bombarda]